MTVYINGWRYKSNLNSLRVVFSTQLKGGQSGGRSPDTKCGGKTTNYNEPNGDDILFTTMTNDGLVYSGRFLPVAMADGRPTHTRNEIIKATDTSTLIGLTVAQCSQCIFDPDVTVLIDADSVAECGDQGGPTWATWKIIVVAVVACAVVVAVVLAIFIFARQKAATKRQNRHIVNKLQQLG
ncbi:hypothetical protein SAMD00019534_023550 [Acytostelium subglobosum LB1]|uniref:hypothetical protein n=1 Tax=Acytostelium subglobosum LB1 TaxID=1410327 RepID=UPI000644B7BA|nr:hypothetical protein SAMD00019534_023550 [Acytostelium subglobosum LB1]GAM19180.1 hypothetical protein SAMD00019534_023550 [Acytostelium subglobosum LB1]|eukprot:XP_012757107.1 hypothetical protein SAMD00019534_023550 [Acytostelium subglobosum LB1]